jgi:phosphate transport system permease protein
MVRTHGDRIFRAIATVGGLSTFVILVLIGTFLLLKAWPAFKYMGARFFTEFQWNPTQTGGVFGVGALLFWTVVIASIAMVVAVPVSICIALFISEYCPSAIRRSLTSLVDLLAAIPSLIFGLWGATFLVPRMVGASTWLHAHAGILPLFHATEQAFYSSPLDAGLVLALMVTPIATSVMREVFSQAPPGEKEGALALGGTRWGMIRAVVLPFGRGGIIGGSMLGLGRALGETVAVALIVSQSFHVTPSIIQSGGNSIAANIFLKFAESFSGMPLSALMASGVVLFAMTLTVNMLAAVIVNRSRSGVGVEI